MAAPWTLQEGEFYTRLSFAEESLGGSDGQRRDFYLEYGLTDKWTLSAKAEAVGYEDLSDEDGSGQRVTLRRKIYQTKHLSVTAEVGLLQGRAIGGLLGCEKLGVELRGGAAWTGALAGREMFAFTELAQRDHNGCRRERFEAGLGSRVSERIWIVSQFWAERGNPFADSDKVQTEWIWRDGPADYAFGYRQELGGDFDESAMFAAYARRF